MSLESCNRCGDEFLPVTDAVVPTLRCIRCGRELPAAAMPPVARIERMEDAPRRHDDTGFSEGWT